MRDVFFILIQNIQQDPISLFFIQIILILFFIGLLPRLIFLASYISSKTPLLNQPPKSPLILIITGLIGFAVAAYMTMVSWFFGMIFSISFFIFVSPRFKALMALSVNPSILTTVGILGTFVGIYIGLNDFNIANIDASIPILLKGLKVAFTTSIVGIMGAVILKMVQSYVPDEREKTKDIFSLFEKMSETLQKDLEQSKVQHQEILQSTKQNIETQNKMIQSLYSKINSLEQSINETKKT